MRVPLAILFSVMATSSAFSAVPRSSTAFSTTGLHMSSPVKVPITITGDNVDLTTALSDYVKLKVDRTLGKLSSVPGVSHCDARKLRKYKERRLNGYHGGPNMGENLADVLDAIEDVDTEADNAAPDADDDSSFMDPEQAVITKVKRYHIDFIKMRFSSSATTTLLLAGASFVKSFSIQSSLSPVRIAAPSTKRMATTPDGGDYLESILGEGSSYRDAAGALRNAVSLSPVIRVPDGSPAATVTLTSSVVASDIFGDDFALEEAVEEEAAAVDPLLNNEILKRQHAKKLKREQTKASGGMMRYVKNPLLLVKGKDFADVTITVLIPAFVAYLALKKVSEIAFGKLGDKADALYEKAAKDITYHVGDYESMQSTYNDYKKKLWFNGAPSYINSQLVKRICVAYCTQSAYRDAVAEAGPGQKKITEGWKVLGLDKETATRIFEETSALGFLSRDELWAKEEQDAYREKIAAEERRRQELRDIIDKDGNLIDPTNIDPDKLIKDEDFNREPEDDGKDEGGPLTGATMAKECGNCGYTLFIAAGREAKFFPSGFTCPQCGAARDQFKDVEIDV
ncbi:hypothetical protein ACHAXA_010963 [Cyclostephanos tholiformis]|uniref:Rubredoxin-like domain-containing protein n=1 Tax=Cyclostephanos tholiformis TaxID=382380 RepID=A0ABD3RZU9_9STRA